MQEVGSITNISDDFIWKDQIGMITKQLGKSVGSQKIYVNLDTVPSNGYSTKYHSHSQQEEFFYILSGSGILRLNDENVSVHAGDFFSKCAGKGIAHTFFNSGKESLLILDIGTNEREDTCYYPDDGVYLHKLNGVAQAFKGSSLLADWTSEPNG